MEIFNRNKGIEEVNQMSPLTWAYVGDCVYELYIRTKLVDTTKLKPHELHIKSIKYVKAQAQAETLKKTRNNTNRGRKRNSKKREKYTNTSYC